jgi:CRP/FNR family transcriptional regulator, cyclic AMP receptor protein
LELERELAGLAGTFLGDLDFATLMMVLATATLVNAPSGTVIEYPGMPRIAFVLDGNMRVFITSPDGHQLTVRYARSRSLVGTRARLAGRDVAVRAQALTDTTLVEIDVRTFNELRVTNTSFNHALGGELTRRLEDVYRAFAMSSFGTIRERLAAHLLDAVEPSPLGGFVAPMTHRELAEALGSAREVVTRALRDLQNEGAIGSVRGGVEIANLTKLVEIAGPWWSPSHFVATDGVDPKASFDNSTNAIVAIDGTGSIVYANPAVERTFGWPAGQLVGRPLTTLMPMGTADGFGAHLAAWLSTPREGPIGFGRTFHGRRSDGSEFPAEITLLPARTATGTLIFASVADVSWRQALRSLLAREPQAATVSAASAAA